MRNNETGEFELVVGNKQLLSGFFIVVLLFAVAFAMGYVVGQNTQRPAKMASEGGSRLSRPPCAGFAAAAFDSGSGARAGASAETPAGQQPPADAPPQPTTQPAQESPPARR